MSDKALSQDALLVSLRDIRLPDHAAGGILAELAVVVGLSGLCAVGVVLVLRAFSHRTPKSVDVSLATQVAALSDLAEAERRVALLHLLRVHAPARFAELKSDFYRPDTSVDLDQLETEVARLV